jgi:hypothetical protein
VNTFYYLDVILLFIYLLLIQNLKAISAYKNSTWYFFKGTVDYNSFVKNSPSNSGDRMKKLEQEVGQLASLRLHNHFQMKS